jgi:cob(I)alamin adenosyltransferase
MVRIDRVSTRSGDDGSTGLGDGRRQPKDDVLIAALGSVDEANSWLGLIRSEGLPPAIDAVAERIQQDLFDLGADLCCPPGTAIGERVHRLGEGELHRLDAWLAEHNAVLPALSSFVLPGGSRSAAQWHVLRTVARRAEREVITAHRRGDPAVNPQCIRYLNRLSDLCFVLARRANDDGRADVLWVPAKDA